jgi:aspartyl-tRNA(Asn)/glutamyl-tRNA(Gln) amidotransferase subunit A
VAAYPPGAFGDVAHVGPMARTVADATLMLDAIKGPDSRDWHSLPDDGIDYRDRVGEGSLEGKRVALSPTLGFAEPSTAVRTAVERAAEVFARLGAVVEHADPFSESPMPIFETLAPGRVLGFVARADARGDRSDGPGVTQTQYVEAVAQRVALGQRLRRFFDRFDLLLSPTMPIPAAYADARADNLPNPNNSWSWVTYTYVFNLTKKPSCSIPCGVVDGLPVGLMVTGRLYDDLGVLRACRAYEAAAGPVWPNRELAASLAQIASAAEAGVEGKRWTPRS